MSLPDEKMPAHQARWSDHPVKAPDEHILKQLLNYVLNKFSNKRKFLTHGSPFESLAQGHHQCRIQTICVTP